MLSIKARNVNDALPLALMHLFHGGVQQACRSNIGGSSTIEYPGPVATTYANPRERVLWHPVRDANPFFHFFESLWILEGRNDVGFLQRFNKKIKDVSDNGSTFHGAYGHRLRCGPPDQIKSAIEMLRADPDSRRVVLQIWDSLVDLGSTSKDVPCNDMVMLKLRDGKLNITVCCRSNDIVWGCYGANVVQFSMLQEYIASHLGVSVGQYTQVSDSYHVYEDNPFWQSYLQACPGGELWVGSNDPYNDEDSEMRPYPLFAEPAAFDRDLFNFFDAFDTGLHVKFESDAFKRVVVPLYVAHAMYLEGRVDMAMSALGDCAPCDWRVACGLWLARRHVRNGIARQVKDQPLIITDRRGIA